MTIDRTDQLRDEMDFAADFNGGILSVDDSSYFTEALSWAQVDMAEVARTEARMRLDEALDYYSMGLPVNEEVLAHAMNDAGVWA